MAPLNERRGQLPPGSDFEVGLWRPPVGACVAHIRTGRHTLPDGEKCLKDGASSP